MRLSVVGITRISLVCLLLEMNHGLKTHAAASKFPLQADFWTNMNQGSVINPHRQQQQALEKILLSPDRGSGLLVPASGWHQLHSPLESPCVDIDQVVLDGSEKLPRWLSLKRYASQAAGHCLGSRGISMLMNDLQNKLIAHGFITTRVVVAPQDLTTGRLTLTIIPGTLRHIHFTPDSDRTIRLSNTLCLNEGQLLSLRDIEQGLENLQRLPGMAASMELAPGDRLGESDIYLRWKQSRGWRVGAMLNDAGSQSTGRYQGALLFSVNNPLRVADSAYMSASSGLDARSGKANSGVTAHYSAPFGYWALAITASQVRYRHRLSAANQLIHYRGKMSNLAFQVSRVLDRNRDQKTTLSYAVLAGQSDFFANDQRIDVQRRRVAGWRLTLTRRHYFPRAMIDSGISYHQGTRWFGALPAAEEAFGQGTAKSRYFDLSLQLDIPFHLLRQGWHYGFNYRQQFSAAPLTPPEKFSIGNRWTVRGFDGEHSLMADSGWYIRNSLTWRTPFSDQALYVGIDYGEVRGNNVGISPTQALAGGVVGLKGRWLNTGYDLFAGVPYVKPDGFKTDDFTSGFSLNWQY
ncbi:hemolysin activation/secretion protein [Biostraticola tofi]|uniref:Hemolysin activation/secretion protein n=2 Tax=Biostraticola tofi TaxID=466109 RepID=A0A4R3Z456_9GAMM|nr:hemolysin activation/secretion protein [Biostraticola tofi]